jgi:hypothetical protein
VLRVPLALPVFFWRKKEDITDIDEQKSVMPLFLALTPFLDMLCS